MKVEDSGCWIIDLVLLVVIVFLKYFLFFELIFELLVWDNFVFDVFVLIDLEFEMVDIGGR